MARNMTLLTDLYEITMAQGYWSQGKLDTEACFYSFYRDNPFGGGYGIFCGANQIAELIDGFGFTDDDIEYLATLATASSTPLFNPAFLDWLRDLELSVDMHRSRRLTRLSARTACARDGAVAAMPAPGTRHSQRRQLPDSHCHQGRTHLSGSRGTSCF